MGFTRGGVWGCRRSTAGAHLAVDAGTRHQAEPYTSGCPHSRALETSTGTEGRGDLKILWRLQHGPP